jgi:hypothetical protein
MFTGFGDAATAVAYANHNLYLTGFTTSAPRDAPTTSFPLSANACFTSNNSAGIGFGFSTVPFTSFVLELTPTNGLGANQLTFSTLLGGSGRADIASGIKVDSNGLIVVTGLTFSTDFPVTSSAFQSTNATAGQTPS